MAAESLNPAIVPTTQAAPKLGKSMRHVIRLSASASKFFASLVSPPSGTKALATNADAIIPSRSYGPLMAITAVQGQQCCSTNLALLLSLFHSNCPFKSVASIQASEQGAAGNASNSRPFRDGSRLTLHRVISADTSVAHLNRSSGPAAVLRRVWPVIVDAVQRHLRPRLTHVSKEVLELQPALADRYSATSVIAEEAIVGVETPLSHSVPNTMHPTAAHAVRRVRLVKRGRSRGRAAFVLTAARDDLSVTQMPPADILLCAAVTSDGQKLPVIRHGDHRQQSEPRSRRHINSLDHLCTFAHMFKEGKRYAF